MGTPKFGCSSCDEVLARESRETGTKLGDFMNIPSRSMPACCLCSCALTRMENLREICKVAHEILKSTLVTDKHKKLFGNVSECTH